jgi:hypothetical protein
MVAATSLPYDRETSEEALDAELDDERDPAEELVEPCLRCESPRSATHLYFCDEHAREEREAEAAQKLPCSQCGKPRGASSRLTVCSSCVWLQEDEKQKREDADRHATIMARFEASPFFCTGGCGSKMLHVGVRCSDCDKLARAKAERVARARATLKSVPERLRWAALDSPLLLERVLDHSAIPRVRAAVEADHDRGLFIGPAGVGKTVLAVSWLRATSARREVEGGFVDAFSLANARRNAALGEEAPLVVDALDYAVLVIDDLGSEPPIASSPIPEVIFARHAAMRTTIVTSGFPLDDLEKRYGAGVARRLSEDSEVIEMRFPEAAR